MSDAFVPEADRLDQDRDVERPAVDDEEHLAGARDQPLRIPLEAPEADVLEQSEEVTDDRYE